jgi:hypothetical protein
MRRMPDRRMPVILLLAEADPLTGCATKGRAIKIKFLFYSEVTPKRWQLKSKMVL